MGRKKELSAEEFARALEVRRASAQLWNAIHPYDGDKAADRLAVTGIPQDDDEE